MREFDERGCRTPPGVRELKLFSRMVVRLCSGRTPPGVRELKPWWLVVSNRY